MKKIAVLGNPNTGKSSIFNLLTGLRQQTGNFAGVTVDLKKGLLTAGNENFTLIDFPGTYSIYPRSNEEQVVFETLKNPESPFYPDAIIGVVDASNLERNLLLFDQLYALRLPSVLLINMADKALRRDISLDLVALQQRYPHAQLVEVNGRIGLGKDRIIEAICALDLTVKSEFHFPFSSNLEEQKNDVSTRKEDIHQSMLHLAKKRTGEKVTKSQKMDKVFLHPIAGYTIFLVVLFLLFQAVFTLSAYPMDALDQGFGWLAHALAEQLPQGIATDLLTEGIIPGVAGVAVFIPQIALLFLFLGILEETGYLSRVIFLMDRLMRPLGLNGRSVVPLISSWACAVPGIMAARMITNWKERMITIMVAPLMSCSARIPVYTILIALVIPDQLVGGWINVQGLVLLALYLLGLVSALFIAFILNRLIRNKERSFLMLELPSYHFPYWNNVRSTVYQKTKSFVLGAGKIILALSIFLWFAASFGPEGHVRSNSESARLITGDQDSGSAQLEKSFIGIFGQTIEPVIRPLGYDWKIGIALITSFAAREVFVGTLATIYSVEDVENNEGTLIEKMRKQTFRNGTPVFTLATGISLLIFYVYALQCMATVAVVQRETKSWVWPIGQLVALAVIAYLLAFLTYQFLK